MNKDVLHIINQGESEQVEFKQNFNQQTIETIVAFANTKGGKVYLGINDKGNFDRNFKVEAETIPVLLNEIKTKTHPALIPDIEIVEIDGFRVLEITV